LILLDRSVELAARSLESRDQNRRPHREEHGRSEHREPEHWCGPGGLKGNKHRRRAEKHEARREDDWRGCRRLRRAETHRTSWKFRH